MRDRDTGQYFKIAKPKHFQNIWLGIFPQGVPKVPPDIWRTFEEHFRIVGSYRAQVVMGLVTMVTKWEPVVGTRC